MAHIHFETTADVAENAELPDILQALADVLAESPGIDPTSVRAFHSLRGVWVVGPGAPPGFAHCDVSVFSNLTVEQREGIAVRLWQCLAEALKTSFEDGELAYSLNVRDVSGSAYQRSQL
jgi:5-carboxymethyl-2-hydroxymuconate isomerase